MKSESVKDGSSANSTASLAWPQVHRPVPVSFVFILSRSPMPEVCYNERVALHISPPCPVLGVGLLCNLILRIGDYYANDVAIPNLILMQRTRGT
jgi:hypothetical protein